MGVQPWARTPSTACWISAAAFAAGASGTASWLSSQFFSLVGDFAP